MRPIAGITDSRRTSTTTSTTAGSTTTTTTIAGALPTIEGYGSQVNGHLGGPSFTTYTVTSLGTGAGSLVNGIASNRRIIFAISGTINSSTHIGGVSNLTIDGTTAPYPGITISTSGGDGLAVESGNNILIQGLAFVGCSGDGANASDNGAGQSPTNVCFRHCIAYGNHDGNIDFSSDAALCTMQYCIIGNHVNPPDNNTGGTLVTGNRVSTHHNLFFPSISPNPDEGERLPFTHRNYGTPAPGSEPDCDTRWNLVYKFGRNMGTEGGYGAGSGYNAKMNAVGNYFYTAGIAANDALDTNPDGCGGCGGFIFSDKNISGNGINLSVGSGHTNHAEYPIPVQYRVADEVSACAAALKVLQYAGPTQRDGGGNRPPTHAAYINGVSLPLPGC